MAGSTISAFMESKGTGVSLVKRGFAVFTSMNVVSAMDSYHTRQPRAAYILSPALQPKASLKAGRLLTTPFVLNLPGEWGFVCAQTRARSGRTFSHQSWP